MRMGLREANQRFSRVVRAVKSGHEVMLTDRGQPIAVIKPFRAGRGREDAIREMAAAGLLRRPTRPGPMPTFRARSMRGRPISDTLREGRDAR